jgi:hypothetical protein
MNTIYLILSLVLLKYLSFDGLLHNYVRFFNFNDMSNFGRFSSYSLVLIDIFANTNDYFFRFMENDAIKESLFVERAGHIIPHNTLLFSVYKYGIIPSILYFYLTFKAFSIFFNKKTLPVIIFVILFSLFLHQLLIGFNLIIVFFCIVFTHNRSFLFYK